MPNFGLDRRLQHELKKQSKPLLFGSPHADDEMDEADYDCCASSAFQTACSGSQKINGANQTVKMRMFPVHDQVVKY